MAELYEPLAKAGSTDASLTYGHDYKVLLWMDRRSMLNHGPREPDRLSDWSTTWPSQHDKPPCSSWGLKTVQNFQNDGLLHLLGMPALLMQMDGDEESILPVSTRERGHGGHSKKGRGGWQTCPAAPPSEHCGAWWAFGGWVVGH